MKILIVDTGKMHLITPMQVAWEQWGHEIVVKQFPNNMGIGDELFELADWSDVILVSIVSWDRPLYALINLAAGNRRYNLAIWTELDMMEFHPINFRMYNWDGIDVCFGDNPAILRRYSRAIKLPTRFVYSPRIIPQLPFHKDEFGPFHPPEAKRFQKKIGLAGSYWRVWKQPFFALECFRSLKIEDPEWTFEMVGSPRQYRLKKLEKAAAELGVKLLSFIPRIPDLMEWYRSCDVILNTSAHEGNPKTMIEAVLCGCRPLVWNWRGAAELYSEDNVFSKPRNFVRKVLDWQRLSDVARLEMITASHEATVKKYRPGELALLAQTEFERMLGGG